ncbi:aspartate aminotransferase family protein [Actinomadura sp. 6N118]|uniref:aspartate aminotransferase family protein n=1 Tax=Actinomadura sp. 6N118 TaxID=3375151 RepID=UPI0037BADFDA
MPPATPQPPTGKPRGFGHARAPKLPVRIVHGEGAWVTDDAGNRYVDCAGGGALTFGHRHPRLVAAVRQQLDRVALTGQGYQDDRLDTFCSELTGLLGTTAALPMTTAVQAMETAVRAAVAWGGATRGVPDWRANVVVEGAPPVRPVTPTVRPVRYGDADAVADAIDERTVAVLVEPVRGSAGVAVPPAGHLRRLRELCTERGLLLVADETESGLSRTGLTLAFDHERVTADLTVLGGALGGGLVPLAAVTGDHDVLEAAGSGAGADGADGNPLACAVGGAVVGLLAAGTYQARARTLGERLREGLDRLVGRGLTAVRTRGLWAGMDVDPSCGDGRTVIEALVTAGVLARQAGERTLCLAPPLTISAGDLDWIVDELGALLEDLDSTPTVPLRSRRT